MNRADPGRIHEVVTLLKARMGQRAIARTLHISRNTVRRIAASHEVARQETHTALPQPVSRARASKLDPFRPQVDELLERYADITAQRVFEEMQGKGFAGSYTVVKDLVRVLRPQRKPKASLVTAVREPGDMAECDWSSYPVQFTHAPAQTLQAFGYTLRFSTRKFFSFHERTDIHALMDGHVAAFARFGGAAVHCKYDHQKPVVLRREGNQPIYNLRFIDFATHYEFQPVACRPRRPNDKPRVERSFYELTLSFFRGRSFRDPADLRAQLVVWLDTICDQRPIKRCRRQNRLQLFAVEQPLLRPLPRHPYDTARVLYRTCDLEGYVPWDGNWYSLPYEYVTDILPVRVTEQELFIYRADDLRCIARHPLLPRGAQLRSDLDGHRPRHAERGPDLDQLRVAYTAMGERAAEFLTALESAQPRSAGYHARKVLALRHQWSTDEVGRALEHALSYGALDHQAVERILVVRGTPRRLEDYVAGALAGRLDPPGVLSARSLAEYDALPNSPPPAPSPGPHPGDPPCPDASPNTHLSPTATSNDESTST